jgi:hypothetical protein
MCAALPSEGEGIVHCRKYRAVDAARARYPAFELSAVVCTRDEPSLGERVYRIDGALDITGLPLEMVDQVVEFAPSPRIQVDPAILRGVMRLAIDPFNS